MGACFSSLFQLACSLLPEFLKALGGCGAQNTLPLLCAGPSSETKAQEVVLFHGRPIALYTSTAGNNCWLGLLQILAMTPPFHVYLVHARAFARDCGMQKQAFVLHALLLNVRGLNDKYVSTKPIELRSEDSDPTAVRVATVLAEHMPPKIFTFKIYAEVLDQLNPSTERDREDNVRDPIQHLEELQKSVFGPVQARAARRTAAQNDMATSRDLSSPFEIQWSDSCEEKVTAYLTLDTASTLQASMDAWLNCNDRSRYIEKLPDILVLNLNPHGRKGPRPLRRVNSLRLTLHPDMLSEELRSDNPKYELLGGMWFGGAHYTAVARTSALVSPEGQPPSLQQQWLHDGKWCLPKGVQGQQLGEKGAYRMLVYAKRSVLDAGTPAPVSDALQIPAGRLMLGQHVTESDRESSEVLSTSHELNDWFSSTPWQVIKERLTGDTYMPQAGPLLDIKACATWLPPLSNV